MLHAEDASGRSSNGRGGPTCFVFLDGVGLARQGKNNPFTHACMPTLYRLIGGPLVLERAGDSTGDGVLLLPLDACLGVDGLPQSATGQTTLFTGINAAAQVGAHVPAYPAAALRRVIAEHSLLKQASEKGLHATFANAYTDTYWDRVREKRLRHSASTLATMAADLPFRTLGDLQAGQAVYWDITHEVMREMMDPEVALVTPEDAGRRLARLTAIHDLVLFESFLTDLAGHRRLPWSNEEVLQKVDGFLGGLLEALPKNVTLVLSSDHGNLEDSTTRSHTRNPVPLLVVGPGTEEFRSARSIADVSPLVLSWMGRRHGCQP